MRLLFIICSGLLLLDGCKQKDGGNAGSRNSPLQVSAGQAMDSSQYTDITWKEQILDFGKIVEGQKLEVIYHFKNTGTKPLVISKVEPGCGCTVTETPTEPIAPGKEGIIKGVFDSNDRTGTQHKSIFVYANTRGSQTHELVFNVEVGKKS